MLRRDGARELQRIALESIWVQYGDDGQVLVDQAPLYDYQGTLQGGDFDFDGNADFAVQVDQTGPYGGPTFDVYIYDSASARFVRSVPFSNLTRTTLGFFQVDAKRRRLVTFAKSGCCYHVTEEHAVVRRRPVVVRRRIEQVVERELVVTEEERVHGRWRRHRSAPRP